MSESIKVWITKYALSAGIRVAMADVSQTSEAMITVPATSRKYAYDEYFHGNDWHRDEQSAIAKAEEMRTKKIASLEKQIAKLQTLKFEVKDDQE